jgi:biopolymer transport protein TolR
VTRIPRGAAQFKWRRQRQEKARRWPTLNLVALMDVFTILVFFFLVHSTESTPLVHGERVNLPESVADQQPRDTPVVTITPDTILLEGETVIAIATAMQSPGGGVPALHTALRTRAAVDPDVSADADMSGRAARELTIVGDRTIPFELLNRVMHTCTQAGYGNISLSVLQRATGAG